MRRVATPGRPLSGAVLIDLSRADAHDPDCPPDRRHRPPAGHADQQLRRVHGRDPGPREGTRAGRPRGRVGPRLAADRGAAVGALEGASAALRRSLPAHASCWPASSAGRSAMSPRHEPRCRRPGQPGARRPGGRGRRRGRCRDGPARAGDPDPGPGPIGKRHIGAGVRRSSTPGVACCSSGTPTRGAVVAAGRSRLPSESPLAAAQRELREETTLVGGAGRLTGVYYELGHDFGPMLHFVFRCTLPTGASRWPSRRRSTGSAGVPLEPADAHLRFHRTPHSRRRSGGRRHSTCSSRATGVEDGRGSARAVGHGRPVADEAAAG